jgi:arginyl-tRNA synthetase
VIEAFGSDPQRFAVVLVQFVSLIGGRMGKRSGNMVTLRELLEEVGPDAARFFYLLRSQNNTFDFDLRLAKEQTPENPVFYVQYGHARICQLLERARRDGHAVPAFSEEAVRPLRLPEELAIIRAILSFPEAVAHAAAEFEPHRVPFYLQDLLGLFHSYYTRYKTSDRIVSADAAKTGARLLLCEALRCVIRNGLTLLGVSAPARMEAPAGEEG